MKIKCEWCDNWINDYDKVCPNCGGVNDKYVRQANGIPKTIEELKEWAKQFTKANIGDGSPLYQYGFADISATLSASSSKNIYYAEQLSMTSQYINDPDNDPDTHGEPNWISGDKYYVAVATGEVGGKKYMVALFKTTAEKNPEYNKG